MTAAPTRLTPEQYLAREERSEFVGAEVYAMVGTTLLHNRLALRSHFLTELAFESAQVVRLESVGVKLPLRTLYADTKVS